MGRDVISEVIEQAAKETSKNDKPAGETSTSAAAETLVTRTLRNDHPKSKDQHEMSLKNRNH
jgi:hypothetical protein